MSSPLDSVDPLVQIRLSDLLALRAAAANTGAVPAPRPPPATAVVEPLPEYLTAKQAAALLSTSTKSLDCWRQKGTGPKYVRLGAAIRYARADLEAWVRSA